MMHGNTMFHLILRRFLQCDSYVYLQPSAVESVITPHQTIRLDLSTWMVGKSSLESENALSSQLNRIDPAVSLSWLRRSLNWWKKTRQEMEQDPGQEFTEEVAERVFNCIHVNNIFPSVLLFFSTRSAVLFHTFQELLVEIRFVRRTICIRRQRDLLDLRWRVGRPICKACTIPWFSLCESVYWI